ncbi:MAG: carboxypeptidase regulatory-like domain-containing protein, partial [Candidatus Thermoplasmatota archaeon]
IWSGHNGDSFLQYKIYFNTTDTDQTPVLKDVKIMYNILPDPPTLISPENNIWINNSKPKFTWKFNDNDSLSQSGYQLQLDDNYDFSSIDYDSGEVSSENTSYIPQTKIADGTWYWRVKTKDSDNDWGDYSKDVWTVKIDTMPPITNHTILGKIGENGWYISDVQLTLLPLDIMSGVAETKYQVDNSEWKVYTAPFNVSGDGEHTMSYYSKDHAGNEEIKKNITIKIDTTAPYLNILEPKNGTITNKKEIYINGTTEKDAKIKINGLDVNLVDNKFRYKIELTEEGENIIEILAIDDAGNEKLMRIYIILKPELSTLNGKVKDSVSNAYIEGVGVSIFYSNGTLAKQTLTNQNGEYSFLNLEKGTYYISADKEGYNPYQAKMLVLFSGINYFNFTIQPKEGSLSLTIVDSNGNFVSDAKVKVMQNSNLIWEGKSDKKGKVAPNLQPGNYKVSIEKEGYIPYETNVTISPGKDFSLQPTLLIKKKKAEEFPLIYLIIIISIACVCAGIAGGIKLSKSKKEEKPEEHIGIPGIGVGKEITPTAPPTIMEGVKEIKCIVCSGTIKSGSPIARCHWCNIPFHQSCANRLVECPKCKRVV